MVLFCVKTKKDLKNLPANFSEIDLYCGEGGQQSRPTSFQSELQDDQFRLYPNPASGILTVTTLVQKEANGQAYNIEVFDLYGRKMYTAWANSGEAVQIETHEYAVGTYLCRITDTNGQQVWIKQFAIVR